MSTCLRFSPPPLTVSCDGIFGGAFTGYSPDAAVRTERSLNLWAGMNVAVCSALDLANQGRLFVRRPTVSQVAALLWPRAHQMRPVRAEVAALWAPLPPARGPMERSESD